MSDIGTMCYNMNVINNVNAKTTNAMDNFNPCKEYVNIETDAFLVAATMEYFGMHKFDEPAENVIPPDILNASKQEKRIWLHRWDSLEISIWV